MEESTKSAFLVGAVHGETAEPSVVFWQGSVTEKGSGKQGAHVRTSRQIINRRSKE